ncbi:MAG: TonB-dependent receptor [Vicinamibacterales bacterium]
MHKTSNGLARCAWSVIACVVGLSCAVIAQGTQVATLRGAILDPDRMFVTGASVVLRSGALLSARMVVSDDSGEYVFYGVPPGEYDLEVSAPSFAPGSARLVVPLGAQVRRDVVLTIQAFREEVQVVAPGLSPAARVGGGAGFTHQAVDALPVPRSIQGIATLSPGVSELTPNAGQLSISGGFAFDNVFLLNGVAIDDNVFGTPQDLFIEDAIEETQVLTSGISAEFGRFSGGVVNAVTRSGGNRASGTYRLNLANPAWVQETPFERANGIAHASAFNATHEATLGGPIARERAWFFTALRAARQSVPQTLRETGIGVLQRDRAYRVEAKATLAPAAGQTLQAGYLGNARSVTNTSGLFSLAADPATLVTRSTPNWYAFANYKTVLRGRHLAELQYSERRFAFSGAGTSRQMGDSPYYSPSADVIYNAPYFDASDQDHKDNRQFTGNLLSSVSAAGEHDLKAGYEFFLSRKRGGGSQSATDYVIDADYLTGADGAPLLDSAGRLVPLFVPGETVLEHYVAIKGATLDVRTQSAFVVDHWRVGPRLTADLGLRVERATSHATGTANGVRATLALPRLAVSFAPRSDGHWFLHGSWSRYAGRYNEAQIAGNTNVGNADYTLATYAGPAGQGRAFQPGLNPANYDVDFGSFPAANVRLADNLHAPLTREVSVGFGAARGRSSSRVSYVWRHTTDVIDDMIARSNGTTRVVRSGFDAGTFTNVVWANSPIGERRYEALVAEGHTGGGPMTLDGLWTIQLKNDGNYEGEATNQPGAASPMGNYAEAFSAERQFPWGRLNGFQRSRGRLWATVRHQFGSRGSLSASALARIESGAAYSLRATGQSLTTTQRALLSGYPDRPSNQVVFFGPRGGERFKGYTVVDLALTYDLPMLGRARPYAKLDVFNALGNDTQIAWNTTVRQDPASPKDALGLATGYVKAASFGSATSNAHFPQSALVPGIRGARLAFGVRF